MWSAQAEVRQRLWGRLGAVAFAGAGETHATRDLGRNSISFDSDLRYAGGLGLRFRLSKAFPIDLSLDASLNDGGDEYIYFYVGQYF